MPKASSLSAIFQWNLRLGRGVQRTKKNQQTEMNRAELDPKGLFLRFTVRFGLGNMENTNISLIFIFRCQKPNEPENTCHIFIGWAASFFGRMI